MAGRRLIPMLAVFVATTAAGVSVVLTLPRTYRAEAVILVSSQRVPSEVVPATVTTRMDEQLGRVRQHLMSRTTLEPVIQDFDLYSNRTRHGVSSIAIESMREDVRLDVVRSDAFRISYVTTDPTVAWQVTDRLSRLIVDEHTRQRTNFAVEINRFLGTQLAETRAQLTQRERELDEYRQKYAGELPAQVQANLLAQNSAQTQAQTIGESINRDRDRLESLQRAAAALPPPGVTGASTSNIDPPAAQLAAAKSMLSDLEKKLTAEHPDMRRQRRVVRDLEEAIAARPPAARAPSASAPARENRIAASPPPDEITSLSDRIAVKEAERRRLLQMVIDLQTKIEAAAAHEAKIAALLRDHDTLQKLYTSLLTKSEESKIAASLEQRQVEQPFRLLDPARVPDRPFGPNRRQLAMFALLAALALASGLGAVLEARDTSIHDEADLRVVSDLPLLGMVSEIVTIEQRARRRVAALAALLVPVLGGMIVLVWWTTR